MPDTSQPPADVPVEAIVMAHYVLGNVSARHLTDELYQLRLGTSHSGVTILASSAAELSDLLDEIGAAVISITGGER